LGIGDWGLGIGDWGVGPIPNPQSPNPNPHPHLKYINYFLILNEKKHFNYKNKLIKEILLKIFNIYIFYYTHIFIYHIFF